MQARVSLKGEIWNPWHGCVRFSEGCKNCYVYRRDDSIGKDASKVYKTQSFDLPVRKNKNGEYKLPSGSSVYACMTSDFFLDLADEWRGEAWSMIKQRSDVDFTIITKRIERFYDCIPDDWGDGYDNVAIVCTIENQKRCDLRFPIFLHAPIKHKFIACEPLLTPINMEKYLCGDILQVLAGGESGTNARVCDYEWVLDIRRQCMSKGVRFYFKQTGARFKKDGRLYIIKRQFQHSQARKAGINT